MRTPGDQSHWHLLSLLHWHLCLLYFFSDCAEEEALCNGSSQRIFPPGSREPGAGSRLDCGLLARWLTLIFA